MTLTAQERAEVDRISHLAYAGGPGDPQSDVRWLLGLVARLATSPAATEPPSDVSALRSCAPSPAPPTGPSTPSEPADLSVETRGVTNDV